jgi:hypothetical protein
MTETMTNAMYQLTQGDTILRLTDNAFIPPDPANTDYAAYLAWVEEGNTPDPAPVPPITWSTIRSKRDQLISESDWTMIPGATVDQLAWSSYRQILRDLPQTYLEAGVDSVIWPNPPSTSGPNTTGLE